MTNTSLLASTPSLESVNAARRELQLCATRYDRCMVAPRWTLYPVFGDSAAARRALDNARRSGNLAHAAELEAGLALEGKRLDLRNNWQGRSRACIEALADRMELAVLEAGRLGLHASQSFLDRARMTRRLADQMLACEGLAERQMQARYEANRLDSTLN